VLPRCLTVLLLAALPLPAALSILPLRDVKAGMRAIGKTVFTGDKVENFDVEILGVLDNIGPKQSLILGRLSGGPLEHTGVMQGMSGSPVYIDGKLIGAVALAFPYSKDPIAGIRPIEEMLRVEAMNCFGNSAGVSAKPCEAFQCCCASCAMLRMAMVTRSLSVRDTGHRALPAYHVSPRRSRHA